LASLVDPDAPTIVATLHLPLYVEGDRCAPAYSRESLYGLPLMKFTLTYDGELKSNGNPKHKWEIRKSLSPQLAELWAIDPILKYAKSHRYIPLDAGGVYVTERHHSDVGDPELSPDKIPYEKYIDTCSNIERKGWSFLPLVRESLALHCALNIRFLRKEPPGRVYPGRVYQGGDLDNRIKTLLDALQMPNDDQIISDARPSNDIIFCLLEDDALISGLNVQADRLLSRPGASKHEVRLIIEVEIRVFQARFYNHPFLGG
jgi:hypothetical protein